MTWVCQSPGPSVPAETLGESFAHSILRSGQRRGVFLHENVPMKPKWGLLVLIEVGCFAWEGWSSKIDVSWVQGICIYTYIYMQDVHVHGMEQRHSNMCLKNNQTHNDLWNDDKKVCGHWSIGNHNNKLQINFIVAEWNKNGTRTCLRYQYQASSTRKQGVSNSHESDKKLPMTGSIISPYTIYPPGNDHICPTTSRHFLSRWFSRYPLDMWSFPGGYDFDETPVARNEVLSLVHGSCVHFKFSLGVKEIPSISKLVLNIYI